jgi:hypothetical protein
VPEFGVDLFEVVGVDHQKRTLALAMCIDQG